MNVVVVGAGPVGLFCGMALARRGHIVSVIDRDPPPSAAGSWRRRNVMQFQHPHFFQSIMCQLLLEHLPEVWGAAVSAGGLPVHNPGFPEQVCVLETRRSTFERAMWCVAASEPELTLRTGSARRMLVDVNRVKGVLVEGSVVDADVVIIATGRASHLGDEYRAPGKELRVVSPARGACTGRVLGWSRRQARCPCSPVIAGMKLPCSLRTTVLFRR